MNKVYPITAGIGVVLACAFDFFRRTLDDICREIGLIRPKAKPTKPTPVPEEDYETVVAPTG